MTTTMTPASARQAYLDAFADLERRPAHPAIARLRQAGIARFDALGFPGPRDEDWKFTSLAPLFEHRFEAAGPEDDPLTLHTESGADLPPGVIACKLSEALARYPDGVEAHLGRLADPRQNVVAALNTAFLGEGVFVLVPAGTVVVEPIHVDALVSRADRTLAYHRRVVVVVERGAQVTLVERYASPGGTPLLTTAVTEVLVGENAELDHYKLQEEGDGAFHLAVTQAVVERAGRFSTHYLGLGARLARNEVRVRFDGEGAEATVNGLYQASGNQQADNLTVIDHAKPHCNSHELYKGILDGRARGVFNGKIFVRLDAQKTDAKQTNQTLLLSDDATINTKPQLEIYADDVKCTHGATVGQLDATQLFYLRSRGIGADQARALLTFAFANDVVSRVKVDRLRHRLEGLLLESQHLPRLERSEDE